MRGHATQVAALSQVKKEQDPGEERRIPDLEEELLLEDGRLLRRAMCDLFSICRSYAKQFSFPPLNFR